MTEQQIKQLIADIEERLWLKTLGRSFKRAFGSFTRNLLFEPIKGVWKALGRFASEGFERAWLVVAVYISLSLLLSAFGLEESIRFYAIRGFAIIVVAYLIAVAFISIQEMIRPKPARIWDLFTDHYKRRQGILNEQTEKMRSRILSLYQLDEGHYFRDGFRSEDGSSILRVEQAAQLLNIYEKERRRLVEVNRELKSNESRHQEIKPHIVALKKRHGEINQEGEYLLKMLDTEKKSLLAAKSQFEQSVNNLELILKAAEDERDARAHHRFISQKVSQYSKTTLPGSNEASRTDVLRELEEGIAAEIKAYVEIEAELRRETGSVQVAVQPSITQAPGTKNRNRAAIELPKLVKEEIHGEVIEYYPLGEYVVIQPGVQSGLPTIKNTRITAGAILGWLEQGDRPEEIAQEYGIPLAAVQEAIQLAEVYDYERSYL